MLLFLLQERVYENAEAQARIFMDYVQSSKDAEDDFDFEGERETDAGSPDSQTAGKVASANTQ